MTDSKRSEEEVHVLDSQIIRIDRAERRGGSCAGFADNPYKLTCNPRK